MWRWIFIYIEERNHNKPEPWRFRALSFKISLENWPKMPLEGNLAPCPHPRQLAAICSPHSGPVTSSAPGKAASTSMHPSSGSYAPAEPRNEKAWTPRDRNPVQSTGCQWGSSQGNKGLREGPVPENGGAGWAGISQEKKKKKKTGYLLDVD